MKGTQTCIICVSNGKEWQMEINLQVKILSMCEIHAVWMECLWYEKNFEIIVHQNVCMFVGF